MSELLGDRSPVRARLRAAIGGDRPVVVPGACDALSARIAESVGFEAVYMSGFGVAASLLGRPDVGLVTASEMADTARRMAAAIDVPLIADADTGYGNAINVIRTVQEYERAGVAAIQLEDQVAPKRCGHMAGKSVVPAGEMAAKIQAAVDARIDPDLAIIARTDAVAVTGVADAIDRARRYADAGADLLFVEAPRTIDEIEAVAAALSDHRLVFNWAEGGRTPGLGLDEIAELGFAMVLYPIGGLLSAVRAIRGYYEVLAADGAPTAVLGDLPAFDEMTDFLGLPEINALGERFADR
ncbi:isocitrate lyase/PEP mutase family protein [Gordonia sp. CPCC 206044]|uniref:isocitrate lyase/PEP mutase family protein n=1 Tax=Gordonia sp. CPCC 206044 TaxID=3140793 RepID=UPI003AF40942